MNKELLDTLENMNLSCEDLNTLAEIALHLKAQKELEEAEAEKNAILDEARENLIEAVINYGLALELLTKEELKDIDWDAVMEGLKVEEKKLKDFFEVFDLPRQKDGGAIIKEKANKPLIIKGAADIDGDIIKKWLNEVMN